MRALPAFWLAAALGLVAQAGIAAAQTKLPSTVNKKPCSYNACIRECIQTKLPACDRACQQHCTLR
jgi:hypothetical protein